MKQTERLLQLVNLLRNRRTVLTAQQLADEFGVSLRTIYRDIQKLESSGIPIEGEAGVGYRIHRSVNLPPLMFDADEVEALPKAAAEAMGSVDVLVNNAGAFHMTKENKERKLTLRIFCFNVELT